MNVISLFVIGYIARKLGTSDFGIFNFVTTFTMLFYPVAMMGLNRVTIRDLAGMDERQSYAGKMVTLRIVTTFFAIVIIILAANIIDYPQRTTFAMYLACFIFMFQLFSESLTDIYNACERMEFTALVRMVAGLTLTALSVIVLYLGFGLYELIGVYAFGQMIGCAVALYLIIKFFFKIRFRINWSFIKEKMRDGFQFFLMTMMWFAMMRLDTIFLSKKISMTELGLYLSAIILVRRLSIVPQGIAGSLLPAISNLQSKGKINETSEVICTFFTKISLIALPAVIIVSFFADDIIKIIFGGQFDGAGIILRIGIWAFLFRCFSFLEFSVLTAFHKEHQMLKSYVFATIYCVISNIFLIHFYGSLGAVLAFASTQLTVFIFFTIFTYKTIRTIFYAGELFRITILNGALFLFLFFLRSYNIFWVIPSCFLFYFVGALILKLLTLQNLLDLKRLFKTT